MTFHFSDRNDLIDITSKGAFCPYCRIEKECTEEHLLTKYWSRATLFSNGFDDTYIVPCNCAKSKVTKDTTRSHWHCHFCSTVTTRPTNFQYHLRNTHDEKGNTGSAPAIQRRRRNDKGFEDSSTNIDCNMCVNTFENQSSLRRHQQQIHNIHTDPVYCVDSKNGIYFIPRAKSRQRSPIHVEKTSGKKKWSCEIAECREFMAMACRSGHPALECKHLKMAEYAKPFNFPKPLLESSLEDMVQQNLISTTRQSECKDLLLTASCANVCAVFPVFYGKHGFSERFIYFSVYTAKQDYWCLFQRTRVTFDSQSGQWHCRCKGSHKAPTCVHRYISMWWLYQEDPQLIRKKLPRIMEDNNAFSDSEDTVDNAASTMSPSTLLLTNDYPPNKKYIIKMVQYLHTKKRIPEQLPQDLTTEDRQPPATFVPLENECPYCPGPTPPSLLEPQLISKNGTIYGMYKIHTGIHVYVKMYPTCGTPVRFQEYTAGFHNYNDRVFLTISLCILITTSLQNHTAIGRFLTTMEDFMGIRFHHDTLRKAFFHFSAMRNYSYDFFCIRCGHHPPILVGDANWKLSFDIPSKCV